MSWFTKRLTEDSETEVFEMGPLSRSGRQIMEAGILGQLSFMWRINFWRSSSGQRLLPESERLFGMSASKPFLNKSGTIFRWKRRKNVLWSRPEPDKAPRPPPCSNRQDSGNHPSCRLSKGQQTRSASGRQQEEKQRETSSFKGQRGMPQERRRCFQWCR